MSAADENHVIEQWREDAEVRAVGGKHEVRRGGRRSKDKSAGTWRCEGRDQCAGQMDIWGCIAEAEADRAASDVPADEFDDPAA